MVDYRVQKKQFRWDKDSFTPALMRQWMAAGELVVAYRGEEMVGLMLLQSTDRMFWPHRPDGEALHVHKLARKQGIAKIEGGLAAPMLDWAMREVRRAGRPYLRLDCAPDDDLCAVYERCGFARLELREIDRAPEPNFWSWLWEKKA